MHKLLLKSLLSLVAVAVLAVPAHAALTLRLADVMADNSVYGEGVLKVFIPALKDASKGELDVEFFPSGQLGSDLAILDNVKLGTIDMAITGALNIKTVQAFSIPFLFNDAAHMNKVLTSPIADAIKQRYKKETGITLVGFGYYAPRIVTSSREIKSMADFKGLKIRTPNNAVLMDTFKALGASPAPIAFSELFTALQQHVVDAQENPYEVVVSNSYYEVQKYVLPTEHSLPLRYFVVNTMTWDGLSAEERAIIENAWLKTAAYIEENYIKNDAAYQQTLKDKGMIFLPVDKAALAEATKDVWKTCAVSSWGEGVYEKIKEMGKN